MKTIQSNHSIVFEEKKMLLTFLNLILLFLSFEHNYIGASTDKMENDISKLELKTIISMASYLQPNALTWPQCCSPKE